MSWINHRKNISLNKAKIAFRDQGIPSVGFQSLGPWQKVPRWPQGWLIAVYHISGTRDEQPPTGTRA